MAGTIKLDQIGNYVEDQMEKLLRAAVLDADGLLKSQSPVKTGRFSASWQVGENVATGGIKPEGNYTVPTPIERLGYTKEKIGNVYSVHNNLPYAEPLANGSSLQTAEALGGQAGWVQGIAKDVQTRVLAQAAKIGRES
jgi:hypothetical protein